MIAYAVNRETKEHRRADGIWQQMKYGTDWKIVQADADGWIPCEGDGVCPIPENGKYQIRLRSGSAKEYTDHPSAHGLMWQHGHNSLDIIAYRPILGEPGETEAVDWDVGSFPPAGLECESYVLAETAKQGRPMDEWRTGISEGKAQAANGGWGCLFRDEEGRRHFVGAQTYFRPIRSEEDRAIEAMLALDDYNTESYNSGMMSRDDFCRALYRAGYRKS